MRTAEGRTHLAVHDNVIRLLAVLGLCSCRPVAAPPSTAPTMTIENAKAQSELGTGVHRLIAALASGDVEEVQSWMTRRLAAELPSDALVAAGQQLKVQFGEAVGILEEHVHVEGELEWYSGLVLYGNGDVITPMLFQFAIDAEGKLERLLVREHWFIDKVKNPADEYVAITRFHFPARGQWYVIHGGRSKATNYHFGLGPQRFAYDIVKRVDGRQRRPGTPRSENDAYYCWGEDILAPAAGTVVYVVNDVAENVPPQRGVKGGNGFVIDHGFGEYSAIWHAIPGSVRVQVGDRVETGEVLARVGNSGRSTGPHIHFHASHRPDGFTEKFGIPAPFVDVWIDGGWRAQAIPVRGQYVERDRAELARGPMVLIDL